MDPKSSKVLPRRTCNSIYRKRKADHVGQSPKEIPTDVSPATPTENGDGTSIWDDNFPFGEFIDNHFITEKDRETFEECGIEKCFHVLKATPIQVVSIVRFMEQKVGDILKKNKAYHEENTELKNKLSESEKKNKAYHEENIELKNKLSESEKNVGNLKRDLEGLKLKTSHLEESEESLMDKITKLILKLNIKEKIVNEMEAETKDLKAEIEDLKAKIEELRGEILLQQKAGFDKAINQVLVSICELKP
jgi:uncharacterized coiled-coil DUF342 family protein